MEQLATGILRRSSDPIIITALPDGTIVDVNEAYFTMTGHARDELVGRSGRDLVVGLAAEADPMAAGQLERLDSITDVPVGFWTRSGELRVGHLSALVLEVNGQRDALCTIRGVREPTPEERRSAARKELDRALRHGQTWSEAATRALAAFGRCLRWEVATLWRGAPQLESLRRVAIWPAPSVELGPSTETARHAGLPAAASEALGQVRLRGEPIWITDAPTGRERAQAPGGTVEPLRGWLGFPALGAGGVVGVVEFASRETSQPDPELLGVIEDFGLLFGRLLEDLRAPGVQLADEAEGSWPGPTTRATDMPDTLRDLADAVAATSDALEGHLTLPHVRSSPVLRELTARIGRLNQLLEQAIHRNAGDLPALEPPARPAEATNEPSAAVPTGLTLKAVSRRTGIPAATLRTWEHRYGFMRPKRSSAGYRLYGEEEIARIERVKHLVGQGVRIGAAMKTVIDEAEGHELAADGRQSPDQTHPGGEGKHAEVYRLNPRSSPRRGS
jgi:PAS domain S-box-containing protein